MAHAKDRQTGIRISFSLYERAMRRARREHSSFSQVVRDALVVHLENPGKLTPAKNGRPA